MKIRLFHITSPESALSILEKEIFYPVSNHDHNHDNGLNCFPYHRYGYLMGQCYEGFGAKLILEWRGETTITSKNASDPLPPNILHDQHNWRCFIRGGTDKKYLRIIGIRFFVNIDHLLEKPRFYSLLPLSVKSGLIRKKRLKFLRDLRKKYQKKPYLTVFG